MGCQEARFACRRSRFHLLTPHLAQKELSGGFKASEARPEAVLSDLAQRMHHLVQTKHDPDDCLQQPSGPLASVNQTKDCGLAKQ